VGDIFRNKFFIILLIVACVLTLSTIILNLSGHGSIVSDITNLILTPFQKFANILKSSVSGFAAYFTEFNRMKEEIEELRIQLEAANARDQEYWRLKDQNDVFHSFYEFKREHTDFEFQHAKIRTGDSGNYLSILTINKGSFHKIEKDMPVIASKGTEKVIIGYVSEVSFMYSKVTSFIRTGAAIGVYIERTEETGVIAGAFEYEKEGFCRLIDLPKDADLAIGDRIYSSGSGGIYPAGLYIGEVVDIEADPPSHTMAGKVKPAMDFNEIKDVMVVLSFERKFY